MNKYLKFCKKKCMEGKMDLSKNYYVLNSDEEIERNKNNKNIDVSIVQHTQQLNSQKARSDKGWI